MEEVEIGVEGVDFCVETVEDRVERRLHTVETGVATPSTGRKSQISRAVGRSYRGRSPHLRWMCAMWLRTVAASMCKVSAI